MAKTTRAALVVGALVVLMGSTPAGAEEDRADNETGVELADGAEDIGEASDAVTPGGTACRAACATAYAAACLRIQQLCLASTVVTIGGSTTPCATATAVTCLTSVALASVCNDQCPI